MSLTATRRRTRTADPTPAERRRWIAVAMDYAGLWMVRGPRRGKSAARTVAAAYGCSVRTVELYAARAIDDPSPDTEKVRLAFDLIPGRRSIPRGTTPR